MNEIKYANSKQDLNGPKSYPHDTWRLLITPPMDGASNMAIDEAILYAQAEGKGKPTLRFFQWDPPCLSLGYNQQWQDLDELACQQLGYTWVRRTTGGRAILHRHEITYSLIIPENDPRVQGGITASYQTLSFGLMNGLQRLGLKAKQASRDDVKAALRANKGGGPVCFDSPSHYEITWHGKKLIGSAQLRRKHTVLQHGSLPLHGNLNHILDVLSFSSEEQAQQQALLPKRATTLEQALGQTLSFKTVMTALIAGFAEELNLSFAEMSLTAQEKDIAKQLQAKQYANESWLKRK